MTAGRDAIEATRREEFGDRRPVPLRHGAVGERVSKGASSHRNPGIDVFERAVGPLVRERLCP